MSKPHVPQAISAALALATVLGAALPLTSRAEATPAPVPVQAPDTAIRGLPDFTGLVETVGPAVVNIRTNIKPKAAGPDTSLQAQMQQLIEEYIRRHGGRGGRNAPPGGNELPDDEDQPEQGYIGSGFMLSPDGYVMTNAHVVEGADEVTVTLTDKREFKAKIIGSDQRTDVALLKIEAAGLPFVRIGSVDRLKVGEWVIAIGSPFGLESTVTAGIVSAKQRETGDYLQLLQTDVAINPGNSGGPLINMRGEVVGINSQILSPSGTSAGISLAIPIDEAIRVSDQLRASGHVTRGRIGVQIGPVSKQVAETLGLGKPIGALVEGVQAGLPAEKAGIEAGDIITQVQGKTVERFSDLPRLVGMVKPGDKVKLQVFHDGKSREMTADVIDFGPETPPTLADAVPDVTSNTKATLGLKVTDLADADRARLHIKGGVRVDSAEGAGARAGLQEGDVILQIGNVQVTSAKQFAATVAKLDKTKAIAVLVRRGDSANYLVIRPSK
ncbi:Do family serine endopeptidase [Scleromatobacter humisilvae]|uniref:Probable periplasmic serine endoprotease DegP-like n=1 Tax=Scleromatobacter humisilvae TaxID=2897159 RepID=A0A9X1YPL6_9BURK|nr:Do family serine endopeptidase [Scleromatobacter humisilvae]MCK9688312.1 Do family serine endopeptidase [Scleromatobacter humisilvae]